MRIFSDGFGITHILWTEMVYPEWPNELIAACGHIDYSRLVLVLERNIEVTCEGCRDARTRNSS